MAFYSQENSYYNPSAANNNRDLSIEQERNMHSILDEGLQDLRKSKQAAFQTQYIRERSITKRSYNMGSPLGANNMMLNHPSFIEQSNSQYVPLRNMSQKQLFNGEESSYQMTNQKDQSIRRLLDEIKQPTEQYQPRFQNTEGSSQNNMMHQDLAQLQQRIMGLEKKIKEDNESMKRVRDGRNEQLKGIIKQTNSNERGSFSFNQSKKSTPKMGQHKESISAHEPVNIEIKTTNREYDSKDYEQSSSDHSVKNSAKKRKITHKKKEYIKKSSQKKKKASKKHEQSDDEEDDGFDDEELNQYSKKLKSYKKQLYSSESSREERRKSKSSQKYKVDEDYSDTDSLKATSLKLSKLKEQLNVLNKKNTNYSISTKAKEQQQSSRKSLNRSQSKGAHSRSLSSSRRQNASQPNILHYSMSNYSLSNVQSVTYNQEQEQYQKEMKIKKLEGQCKKMARELDDNKAELREERKRNIELMNIIDKMQKKMNSKEFENKKQNDLEEQVRTLTESFQKSELIRKEQKVLITKLKIQMEKYRQQQQNKQEEDSDEEEEVIRPKKAKQSMKQADKENFESTLKKKVKKPIKKI